MQPLVYRPLPLLLRNLIHAQPPLLVRGQRTRFLLAASALAFDGFLGALGAAQGAGVWGGGAEEREGFVLDFVGVDAGGGGGGVGAGEEGLGEWGGLGGGRRGHGVEGERM